MVQVLTLFGTRPELIELLQPFGEGLGVRIDRDPAVVREGRSASDAIAAWLDTGAARA